ncbi:MAG: 3-hydroxyacyl-CoA dehydrogenase [Elusimicrobia bacterium]|nr:3-hydroxyacyl-CoA dehydrogenase [Elusimicrobiota bacterium]
MIQRVGVVGAGTMGAGIAQLCAQFGFSVKVHDPAAAVLGALPGRLKKALAAAVLKGKLTTQQAERACHAISPVPRLEDLTGADLILEAAPEDLALKIGLFERLGAACPDAILATNTSSLSVSKIMSRVALPERCLGIHFFNPPVSMKLVEIIRAEKTSPDVFRAIWDFSLTGLRRTPVDVKDVPGFIVNRVMRPYYVTAQRLAGARTAFSAIDAACRDLGRVPMGPFELMDLIGLDTNLSITKVLFEGLGRPERFTPPALQQTLVDRGLLGRKAGRGFYLYKDGRSAGENPDALALLPAGASRAPGASWPVLRDALIAEAELVVAEGTAGAGDVNTAVKLAMNFPKGPLEWRDAIKLP